MGSILFSFFFKDLFWCWLLLWSLSLYLITVLCVRNRLKKAFIEVNLRLSLVLARCARFFECKTLQMKISVQDSVWHLLWSRLQFCMQVLWSMRLMNNNCICKHSGKCKISRQFILMCSVQKLGSQITANEQQWVHFWV